MNSSSPPPFGPKSRALNITLRTALLSWLVAVVTLFVFVLAILPRQKETFVENLRSKAYGVTVSLRDVAASAVVNEDYSSVVDHCTEILKGDPSIDYIVVTRNDGFSLVHDRSGWRSQTLDALWHPFPRVATGGIDTVPLFGRRVYAFSQPFEYSGIDWGWIHVGLSLESYDRNLATVYRQTALLALGCIVFSLGVSVVYARRLVRPILAIQRVVRLVAGGDLSARAAVDRDDELGILASSVNSMTEALLRRDRTLKEANETLEVRVQERTAELRDQVAARERTNRELAEAQRRLMQLSREAGMAEVATGVLHNVGNVLNSVNVSAALVRETLHGSELPQLQRVVSLLHQHHSTLAQFLLDDPQGRHVLPFLHQLAAQLEIEHARLDAETASLSKNIEHIKEIVAMQQGFARTAAIFERIEPTDVMNHAVAIHQASLLRHDCRVVTDFPADLPQLTTDRHSVVQILINLMANAVHAIKPNARENRMIHLKIERRSEDRLALVVRDNGVGIDQANLPRIFRLGFTTRRDGHGFGLHAGALAARSLGGTLEVFSAGLGSGATFTLILPLQTAAPTPSLSP